MTVGTGTAQGSFQLRLGRSGNRCPYLLGNNTTGGDLTLVEQTFRLLVTPLDYRPCPSDGLLAMLMVWQ